MLIAVPPHPNIGKNAHRDSGVCAEPAKICLFDISFILSHETY